MSTIRLIFNLWLAIKLIMIPVNAFSYSYFSMANGKWSNTETWFFTKSPDNKLSASDTVIIRHHIILDKNIKNFPATLIIWPKASLTTQKYSFILNKNGRIINDGTFAVNNLSLLNGAIYSGNGSLITIKDLFINGHVICSANGPFRIGRNFIINYQNKSLLCDAEVVFNNLLEVGNDIAAGYLSSLEFNNNTVIKGSIVCLEGTSCFNGNIDIKGKDNYFKYSDYIYVSGKMNFEQNLTIDNSKIYVSGQILANENININGKNSELRNFGIISSNSNLNLNNGIFYNYGTISNSFTIADNAHLINNKSFQKNYQNTVKDKNTVQNIEK